MTAEEGEDVDPHRGGKGKAREAPVSVASALALARAQQRRAEGIAADAERAVTEATITLADREMEKEAADRSLSAGGRTRWWPSWRC